MKVHELKTLNNHFEKVWRGLKTFEIRKDDREYHVGDILHLKEILPQGNPERRFTSREILADVTHILRGGEYGLDKDYCILSIKVFRKIDAELPF